ncbi:MAG: 50S ribosomal protein L17 [Coriobacteriales bacterium]|jgi:large subunit ribosomal protein L17
MRHYKKGRKLGTDASHTKAIKKNLAVALFTNDRIKTTVVRAKEMRPTVEHIITLAKKGDLHSRRQAIAILGDKELVREVFAKAEQGMWADRNGGYTRIMKLGPRKGDNTPMAIIELVEEQVVTKKKADKAAEKAETPAKKAEPKADKSADEEATEAAEEEQAADEAEAAEETADEAAETVEEATDDAADAAETADEANAPAEESDEEKAE